jgi:phosphoglycolate phosphatase-like HAD superfamily hydrolase
MAINPIRAVVFDMGGTLEDLTYDDASRYEDVTFFYETHYQTRSLRPEAPVVLDALYKKGFRLAIISNIISRRMQSSIT